MVGGDNAATPGERHVRPSTASLPESHTHLHTCGLRQVPGWSSRRCLKQETRTDDPVWTTGAWLEKHLTPTHWMEYSLAVQINK